jgi:hypothetical protein
MSDATNHPLARPRWLRLQFSLRLLLLAVTAFAIGFPIWYRWPYEEVEILIPGGGAKRVITWQRQWGGGRLKHGPETLTQRELVQVKTYQHGKLHGPFSQTIGTQPPDVTGQFVDEKREGQWICCGGNAWEKTRWHRGKLEGLSESQSPDGRHATYQFASGRLTHVDDQPVANRLFMLLERGAIDERLAHRIKIPGTCSFTDKPLAEAVRAFNESNNLPVVLDTRHVPNLQIPVSAFVVDIDGISALTLITEPHGLTCDYRFGCVWVTTPDAAEGWHDLTGVADIHLAESGALARVWNKRSAAEAVDEPLDAVLENLSRTLAIEIDASQIASSANEPAPNEPAKYPVHISLNYLPFRDILGNVLCQTGCRCRLEGEKLVILPPEAP